MRKHRNPLEPPELIIFISGLYIGLLKTYEPTHIDYNDCNQARIQLEHIINHITHNIHATVTLKEISVIGI